MAPAMTAWAAKWMACCAEPHWRSTVVPGTDSGKPGGQGGVAGDVHRLLPDGHGAAHDHVLHQGGVQVVAGQQGGQGLGGQVGGVPSREAAPTAAHRGADGVDDHGVGHKEAILTPNQMKCQTCLFRRSGGWRRTPTGGAAARGVRWTNMGDHAQGLGVCGGRGARALGGGDDRAGLGSAAARPPPPPRRRRLRAALPAGQQVTINYCNHQKARITEPAALDGPAPAVVYVHGGDWVSGDYDTGGFIINRIGPALAARGFVVVSLNYRLGPRRHWPDQIVDVKCAIRYLRANAHYFNIDPAEIGAWGQSAGGQLVALLGTAGPAAGWDIGAYSDESSQVQAVVDMAGPSDLLTLGTGAQPSSWPRVSFRSWARCRTLSWVPTSRRPAPSPTSGRATRRSCSSPRTTTDRQPEAVEGAGVVSRGGGRADTSW